MKILVDTNVVLDVWLCRKPHYIKSATVLDYVAKRKVVGYLCPTNVTTLHYLSKKELGDTAAKELISSLLSIFEIQELSKTELRMALSSKITDYEDAVLESISAAIKVASIVTRNTKDFKKSVIPAIAPEEFLSLMSVESL